MIYISALFFLIIVLHPKRLLFAYLQNKRANKTICNIHIKKLQEGISPAFENG